MGRLRGSSATSTPEISEARTGGTYGYGAGPMSILLDKVDGTAIVTLNRPAQMNAVNAAVREQLIAMLDELNGAADVTAIVLTGAGERAFCAGQDLAESAALSGATIADWLNRQRAMYQSVRNLDKPCIAALNGVTAGAGLQIALCADLRVGHPDIRLGQPEVKAGLASIVGSYLLSLHVGMGTNTRLSLTGELIDGSEAFEVGLLTHCVRTPDQVLPRALELAAAMARVPPTAMRLSKQRFRGMTQPGFDAANEFAVGAQSACYDSGEPQAVQRAFLAKRDAHTTPTR